MTRNEVDNLLDKIRLYRQFFISHLKNRNELQAFADEWFRILEPYDAEDINENLDKFLMNEDNLSKNPDVYQLIKRTLKITEKKKKGRIYTRCMFCGKEIDYAFDDHEDRCRSVIYISKICNRYLGKNIESEELYKMSKGRFEKKYIATLVKVLPMAKEHNPIEARGIENVVNTYFGKEAKYSINEV